MQLYQKAHQKVRKKYHRINYKKEVISMKNGKVSENVLKRSILKQISNRRDEVLNGAGIGVDCAILAFENNELFTISSDPVIGKHRDIGELAVYNAVNDIYATGGEPVAVSVVGVYPANTYESDVKDVIRQVEDVCRELKITNISGHTEISKAVQMTVLSVKIGRASCRERVSAPV